MNWKQCLVVAAIVLAAPPAAAQMSESVAAIVNDEVISSFDVGQRANLILASAGVQATPEILPRARAQALRDLVDEHLQLQEAKKYHIEIADHEVDERIAQIAHSNQATPEDLLHNLAQGGVGPATFRQQIRADLAWTRLMTGMYRTRLRISPEEVRQTQARIVANASHPQFLVSEIFLAADSEEEFAQMQAGAQRLLEQMQHGAPFPLVARQFSNAPSAAAGGDMGWLAATELPPELQNVVQQLQPGQVSLPVRGERGIYVVALRERREGIAPGAATLVALRQISAPEASRAQLDRLQHRISTCDGLDHAISSVPNAQLVDLGEPAESDLAEDMRARVADVAPGAAAPVTVANGQASTIVVCSRTVGGAGVPSLDEIENRLFEQEMARQAERYLRNLRREASIVTR